MFIQQRPARRRMTRGFTIIEVAFALVILAMMTVMFAAVCPMAVRGAQYSNNYTQATMIAQHKMDQLRADGYNYLLVTDVNGTPLGKMQGAGTIDKPQPTGYPSTTNNVTTYSFTAADGMVNSGTTHGFFPPGSTGTVVLSDYTTAFPSSGVPAGTLAYVTVKVAWTGGGVSNGSYSTSAIIAKVVTP